MIRKVWTLPKAAETTALMRLVDDGTSLARQVSQLLNIPVKTRVFTDSRPLLESIGSLGQIDEKALRQSIAYSKQATGYSWIQGEEIVHCGCVHQEGFKAGCSGGYNGSQ